MKSTHLLVISAAASVLFFGCKKSNDSNSNSSSSFTCGSNLTVTHTAGSVAPVTKTITYHTVSSSVTGSTKCWITQDLGADAQPSSMSDTSQKSRGWYWQFNRPQGYVVSVDTSRWSHYFSFYQSVFPASAWVNPINESSDWQASNDPCTVLLGKGWRVPTEIEMKDMLTVGGWKNADDAFGSVFNLHSSFTIDSVTWNNTSTSYYDTSNYTTGNYDYSTLGGSYWTSSQNDATNGWVIYISDYTGETDLMQGDTKKNAHPIRCIKD